MLCWPVGTVSGPVSWPRPLRSRLDRRGVAVPSAVLSANWLAGTSTTVPTMLLESTLVPRLRLGPPAAVSSPVINLMQGVLNAMLIDKLKIAATVVIVTGCVTGGAGVWGYRAGGSPVSFAQEIAPAGAVRPSANLPNPRRPGQPPLPRRRLRQRDWVVPRPLTARTSCNERRVSRRVGAVRLQGSGT